MSRLFDGDERYSDYEYPVDDQVSIGTGSTAFQIAQAAGDQNISDVVTPPAISATQNNYSLGEGKKFRLSTSGGAQIITGFANVQPGRELFLYNLGPNNITLNNQDAGSDAQNRIITGTGAALVIPTDGACILVYDNISTRWRKTPTV